MKMQRFTAFAVLVIAVVLAIWTGPAEAQGQRLKIDSIKWRTRGAVGTTGGSRDSSQFCTIGTQLTYDTTSAIPTAGWELPASAVWGGTIDTLSFFNLYIAGQPAGDNAGSGFDSLLVQTQVSTDGNTWVDVVPTRNFDATRTTGQANAAIVAGPGTNSAIVVPFWQREILGKLSIGLSSPTGITIWGWPLVRFIVNTSGGAGCFTGQIQYLSSQQ